MKLEVKNQKDNHLLNRTEVEFEIDHSGTSTPRRNDVTELIATKTNRDKKLIVIKQIRTKYGKNISQGLAYIYNDEKSMKFGAEHLIKRGQKKKKEAPEEQAPAEEVKEEVKEDGEKKESSEEGKEAEKAD